MNTMFLTRSRQIDGLRGMLIFLVVLGHSGAEGTWNRHSNNMGNHFT